MANFWLLYTINTHLPGLRHFLESSNVLPMQLFSELSDLASALTAFSTKIEPRDLPTYNHEQLGVCFGELDRLIRMMLETVVPSNFVALPLKLIRDTIYATSIDKDAYFEGSKFYLAVSADIRDADLIDACPSCSKPARRRSIEMLIRNALPGLRLQHVPTPPRAIPVKLRQQYCAIEQSGKYWESVLRARNFAVHAPVRPSQPADGTRDPADPAAVTGLKVRRVKIYQLDPCIRSWPECRAEIEASSGPRRRSRRALNRNPGRERAERRNRE